ncbi:MAG: Arc family DNA-binding protein [Ruminococcus sp.]|nr:Arc family DNA-binding protein [Ruminococcus sp.]
MYSEANKKAVKKYCEKAYDELKIRVYKGQKEQIKKYAESKGLSVNSFINQLISKEMGIDLNEKNIND